MSDLQRSHRFRILADRGSRLRLRCERPLAEAGLDLHDRLRNATRGHGCFDYDGADCRPSGRVERGVLVRGLESFVPRQISEGAIQAGLELGDS